jgi:hypothetical protein
MFMAEARGENFGARQLFGFAQAPGGKDRDRPCTTTKSTRDASVSKRDPGYPHFAGRSAASFTSHGIEQDEKPNSDGRTQQGGHHQHQE